MSGVSNEIRVDPDAQRDLAYIYRWDRKSRWFPQLQIVIEKIPLGPAISYSSGPEGTIKLQPIHALTDIGIPAYHIVWEEKLNGFRPLLLKFDEGETVITGIGLHRSNLSVPGLTSLDYDDSNDEQMARLKKRYKELTVNMDE